MFVDETFLIRFQERLKALTNFPQRFWEEQSRSDTEINKYILSNEKIII